MTDLNAEPRTRRSTGRFEMRVADETKLHFARAAAVLGIDVSDFVRNAAEERADEVLAAHDLVTVVPADYFDSLVAALDEPVRANAALRRALAGARETILSDVLHT